MLKAISEMVPTFSMVMKQHYKYDLYLKSLFLFLKKFFFANKLLFIDKILN